METALIDQKWPLTEQEEMTWTTSTQQPTPSSEPNTHRSWLPQRRPSFGYRCDVCHRKFHSIGNLSNHFQLYKH
ncbi:hypothetical protein DM01DRAFT_1332099 [Hesseltinella vesiculosa]|uniref:C2H2-type domain-containing protein n=1 Tax=Hesseltinella vesiculosa TaxID=101127 RepID=A0A1X2GU43_9FUNG|nr:hypothetical protein DM01DRAFT_1332099 [Hesseltinella vesiculosa]